MGWSMGCGSSGMGLQGGFSPTGSGAIAFHEPRVMDFRRSGWLVLSVNMLPSDMGSA